MDLVNKKSIDKAGNETDNIVIRMLYWTLLIPTNNYTNNTYGNLGDLELAPL